MILSDYRHQPLARVSRLAPQLLWSQVVIVACWVGSWQVFRFCNSDDLILIQLPATSTLPPCRCCNVVAPLLCMLATSVLTSAHAWFTKGGVYMSLNTVSSNWMHQSDPVHQVKAQQGTSVQDQLWFLSVCDEWWLELPVTETGPVT